MDNEQKASLLKQLHSKEEAPKQEEIKAEVEQSTEATEAQEADKDSSLKDSSNTESNTESTQEEVASQETATTEATTEQTLEDHQETFDWKAEAEKNGYVAKDGYYNLDEDEYIKKLVEFKQNGIDITSPDFLLEQNVDYAKYNPEVPKDALEVIAKDLKVSNPDATQDDINYLVEREFGILYENTPTQRDDELDDEYRDRLNKFNSDKRDAEVQSRFKARQALKNLTARQEELRLPKQEIQNTLTQQEIEAQKKGFKTQVREAFKDFDSINVKVGDNDYSLEIPTEITKSLGSDLLENVIFENKAFSSYVKEDGNISYRELGEDYAWFKPETRSILIAKLLSQSSAEATEKVAKSINNAELPTKPSAPSKSPEQTLTGKALLAYQMRKRRQN